MDNLVLVVGATMPAAAPLQYPSDVDDALARVLSVRVAARIQEQAPALVVPHDEGASSPDVAEFVYSNRGARPVRATSGPAGVLHRVGRAGAEIGVSLDGTQARALLEAPNRELLHGRSSAPPTPRHTLITFLPSGETALANRILGEHLRHLRECQGDDVTAVVERLPAHLRISPDDLTTAEHGRNALLRTMMTAGEGLALARAYGAGHDAADDWKRRVLAHQQDLMLGFTPGRFEDEGLGWAHRYQVIEQRAGDVLLACGGHLVPVPLRTAALEEAVWAGLGSRSRGHRDRPSLGALPGAGCRLCQVYRAGVLRDRAAVHAWRREVHQARTDAFAARVRSPGAPSTVVLLDQMLLWRQSGGAQIHAGQMRHLARLADETSLEIRIVPASGFHAGIIERVQLELPDGVLSVSVNDDMGAVYESVVDPRLAGMRARALGAEESLDMLRSAADGTLSKPW
ncbi:Scr1 family TA system antitoxin-like transcriptional regulator [Kitasatospora sp. NPDC056783]|uniref:Scr1 family TA system antitoxin-like transcriptional regulator n=1 Tax=Kitasatospora sp. NPDC056783 TaxID=3345943 RepID=UPI00368A2BDC